MIRQAFKPLLLALAFSLPLSATAASMQYRGQLQERGQPANGTFDLQITPHALRSGGIVLGGPLEFSGVTVRDGLFEVPVELTAMQHAQPELWFEVAVRGSGDKAFETLPGRMPAKGVNSCWSTGGNTGGVGEFLGTVDARSLELRSNNRRVALYLAVGDSPSLIGGSQGNLAFGQGTTISGGGTPLMPHYSADDYATIGGGLDHTAGNGGFDTGDGAYVTIGGGFSNAATELGATIAGGTQNSASGVHSTIGGGSNNDATGTRATIAGGELNAAAGTGSVGGGLQNRANGNASTVPGGALNDALGSRSFAAGYRAKANHAGAFVWADSREADFASTVADQVRLRAAEGLHLQLDALGVDAPDLGAADPVDIVVESIDAQIYLMSNGVGTFGSTLGLGEMSGNALVNTWAIARETTGGGADLRFAFGTDQVASSNPVMVEFRNDGTAFKASGSASWDVVSDRRLKQDVAPIEHALDRLLLLRGVRFQYRDAALPDGIALPRGEQMGFIAQDVAEVFPEWVGKSDDGYLFVGERGTTALMVEALRELEARNAALEARLAALEARLGEPR